MSFATPGWDLNATSIAVEPALSNAAKQKKRKLEESSGGQDAATPQVNVEALLSKFHSLDGKNKQKAQHDKPKDVHKKPKIDKKNDSRPQVRKPAKSDAKPSGPKNKFEKHNKSAAAAVSSPSKTSDPEPSTSTSAAAAPVDSEATTEPEQKDKKLSKKEKKQKKNQNQDQDSQHDAPMSTLQTSMKTKLGGARFRWINQQLVCLLLGWVNCCMVLLTLGIPSTPPQAVKLWNSWKMTPAYSMRCVCGSAMLLLLASMRTDLSPSSTTLASARRRLNGPRTL